MRKIIVHEFVPAQTLSNEERKFVVDLLEANTKKFLLDIDAVSEEQWKFKSAAETWSIGEVSEHITFRRTAPRHSERGLMNSCTRFQ